MFLRYDIIDNADTSEAVRRLEHSRVENRSLGDSLGHNASPEPELPSEVVVPQPTKPIQQQEVSDGAGRGSRTPKGRSPADFESAASASSAIPAEVASD